MRKQTSSGMFSADGLCLAICFTIILATLQVSCTNDNFATNSKDQQQVKGYYGLLKDLDASRDKKSLLEEEGMRFKKGGPSHLDDEGLRFKKGAGSSLLDEEGMRFKKGGSSLLEEEGMRFKKAGLLDDEGMRFRRKSQQAPSHLMNRNAIIRKSVLEGEGLRFKKGGASSLLDEEGMRFKKATGSSLLDAEGMRFRRKSEPQMSPQERLEEINKIKRYFPGHLLNFYPFNIDFTNSYERRSDRSGNRDILEGEGMRF